MVCIYCHSKTKIINSRSSSKVHKTWRRHACTSCKAAFTTYEQPDYGLCFRVKLDNGSLEPLDRDKLFVSVMNSVSHKKSKIEASKQLTETILTKVLHDNRNHTHGVINITTLKSFALQTLTNYDHVAATFYEAHYLSPTN